VYAPQPLPVSAPLVVRLIGVLDGDMIAAFGALERGLVGARGSTVLVDVRDVDVLGEHDVDALVETIARARREGRDVRLAARGLHWRRAARKKLSAQPPASPDLASVARRTIILAHSARKRR
jgi:hypothetical protein